LGYDVYQVANEGKMVAVVPAAQAQAALAAMRSAPYGSKAAIIGKVVEARAGSFCQGAGAAAASDKGVAAGRDVPAVASERDVQAANFAEHDNLAASNSQSPPLAGARVYLRSDFGSLRIMDMLAGEQLPRIC
jgi:hydrogenase expression/formation protein HypE